MTQLERPRVFLDANVLFAGAKRDAAIAELLKRAKNHFSLCTSDFARIEAERHLTLKRPDWLSSFSDLMTHVEETPSASLPVNVELPAKDLPILSTAIARRCVYLVTGDRTHFGPFYNHTHHGVRVVSPAHFASIVVAAEAEGGG
ncbi:MAG: putative toxin-antitoxin system toxin component, PIN family [Opitutales bacterium]